MSNDFVNMVNQMGQGALAAARQLGEINVRAGEKMLQQQFELTGGWLDAASRNLELLAKAKTYQEVLAGQAQLAQEYGEQWLAGYRRAAEILNEAGQAANAVVEDSAKKARENVKKAA